jgi:hypothetical protein
VHSSNNKKPPVWFRSQPILYLKRRSILRTIHTKDAFPSSQCANDEPSAFSTVGPTAITQSTERPTNIADSITSTTPLSTSIKHHSGTSLPASSWPPRKVNFKLTIHPWLDDPRYNQIRCPQWRLYLYNAAQKMCTSMDLSGAFSLVALQHDWYTHPKYIIPGTATTLNAAAVPASQPPTLYTRNSTTYDREIHKFLFEPPIYLFEPATHTYSRTILPTPTTHAHQDATSPTITRFFPIANGKLSINSKHTHYSGCVRLPR